MVRLVADAGGLDRQRVPVGDGGPDRPLQDESSVIALVGRAHRDDQDALGGGGTGARRGIPKRVASHSKLCVPPRRSRRGLTTELKIEPNR